MCRLSVCMLCCVLVALSSALGAPPPPLASAAAAIRETFDKHRNAAINREVDQTFSLATDEGRDCLAGYTAIMVGTTIAKKKGDANLEALLQRYALTHREIVKTLIAAGEVRAGAAAIGKRIKDQKAFVKEVWEADFNSALTIMFVGGKIAETKLGTDGVSAVCALEGANPMFTMRFQFVENQWLFHAIEVAPSIRVMSFNIRYGTANDGENHWDKRQSLVVETIKAFKPDLLGTQETLGFQRDYLAKELTGYDAFGVGRDDGKEKGEMMAVYYRKDRFEKLDGGHFWLSATPDVVGSKSWDSSLPRMCTWLKLRDLQQKDGPPVVWLNTHFDHRGEQARRESAMLIRGHIEKLGPNAMAIVTGDFNAVEDSGPYRALFGMVEGKASPVIDTFRTVHPQRGKDEGSFNSFKTPGDGRIDWIACTRQWKVLEAGIDHTQRDGRWPSDHFPVTAILLAGDKNRGGI